MADNKINFLKKSPIFVILILILLAIFLIFSLINPQFIDKENIRNVLSNISVFGIMALGLTATMLGGNFDISIGSTLGITIVVCAKLFNIKGLFIPVPIIIIIGILVGVIIGALNGFLVTVLEINSIIATLGTLAIFRGLAYLYASKPSVIYYSPYLLIGRGFLFKYIPYSFIYFLIIFLVIFIILNYTKFGRDIYSIGTNTYISRLWGIKVKRTQFFTFIISGVAASISGIILSSQIGVGQGQFGLGYEFKILAICVLGGISLIGGKGSLTGVLISILIISFLTNGLILVNIPLELRDAFQGIILIIAILFDSTKIRSKKAY